MDTLTELATRLPHRSVAPGEVLLSEGDAGGVLFILVDGALTIEKNGAAITSITQPGACVGELSLLLGVPITADVIASEPSTVAVVDEAARVLAEHPDIALALAQLPRRACNT